MTSKKKPIHKSRLIKQEFDVDLTLLGNRQLFLFDGIHDNSAEKIVKELYALDTINHNPIMLYLDSGGGNCSSGLAIINTMRTIKSPIVTMIKGEVCSMGAYISIAGNKRVCYNDSSWMTHDISAYIEETSQKIIDRARYLEKFYKIIEAKLRKYTKLNEKEIIKARNGELWLCADEMLSKGIVDEIYPIE